MTDVLEMPAVLMYPRTCAEVRILERQGDFSKSGKYKWSEEIHTIYDARRRRPRAPKLIARKGAE